MAETKKEVGNLQVAITADAQQYFEQLMKVNKSLEDLARRAANAGEKVNKGLISSIVKANIVTGLLTGALKGGIKAITGLTKALVQGGSMYARMNIATKIAAQNAGISAAEYEKLSQALEDANTYGTNALEVIRTLAVSGLVRMADSLKYVDARSGQTKKGVTALVLAMKDLAAASAIDSAVGIKQLSKFIQSGYQTPEIQRMLAGISNLAVEYREWGRAHGIVNRQLTAQEQALARLDLVAREANKVWGAYAATYATSGKNIASIRDILKSLAEMIGGYLEPIWRVVFGSILRMLVAFRQWAKDNAKNIRAWAVNVAAYILVIGRAIVWVLSLLPGIGKYFKKLGNYKLKPAKTFGRGAKAANQFGASVGKATKRVGGLRKALKQLAGFDEMNVLNQKASGGAGAGLGGGVGAGLDLGGAMADSLAGMDDFTQALNEKVQAITDKIREFTQPIRDFFKWLGGINIFGKPLVEWLKILGSKTLQIVIAATKAWFKSQFDTAVLIAKVLTPVLEAVVNITIKVVSWIIKAAVAIGKVLAGAIKFVISHFNDFVQVISHPVASILKLFSWLINSVVIPAVKSIWSAVSNFIGKAIGFMVGGFNSLKAKLAPIAAWLHDKLVNIWDKVKNAFSKAMDKIKRIGSTIFSPIKAAFKAGINGIIDFLNGFIWRFNSLIDKVNRAGGKIPGFKPISWRLGYIPKLATGGLITGNVVAELGENSMREVVLPLDRNTQWADILAEKLQGAGTGKAQIIVKIGEDTIVDKVIDLVNERSVISNTNILTV